MAAAACGSSATPAPATAAPATEAPATAAPATEAPATEAPATEAPATEAPTSTVPVNPYVETGAVAGSGAGKKIGYISLGEQVPFAVLVSNGIKEQAKIAGVELVFCDSKLDTPTALACAQQFAVQGVQGVLNFNVDQKASPQICDAYNNVPTIAIDITQPPCEVAFMGANNSEAGRIAGAAAGKFAKEEWACDYTSYISLESTGAKAASDARMGGFRKGFTEYCPLINEKIQPDVDRTDKAIGTMADVFTATPGERLIVVGINEDGVIGALAAAKTLGREKDVFVAGQGADEFAWKDIACNPQYIGSTLYFPENYGKTLIPAILDILGGKAITADGAGGTVPQNLFTTHALVNSENIRDFYPQIEPCS
ncbi:MAG TPA: substrate-binding domain-containing protein [Candidatus Limnocylindrales bacterium]|nr:substrate-binding domain-containing protein [Candidatus Limnocylindrales bacterium]